MNTVERGKSLQKLAQIFATLASGFFLVAGVFISLGRMMTSSSFEVMKLQYKITRSLAVNDTINSTTGTNLTKSAIELMEFSIDFHLWGFAFLSLGIGLSVGAISVWYNGHRLRCNKKSILKIIRKR